MLSFWLLLFSDISFGVLLIALSIGAFAYKRLNVEQKQIWYLVIVSCFFETIVQIGFLDDWIKVNIYGNPDNNLPGLHVFTALHGAMLFWIYKRFLDKSFGKWMYLGAVLSYLSFAIINAVWIDGIWKMNPHARALESILVLFIVFRYFYNLLQAPEIKRLEKEPFFWLSAGLTIYFAGSLFIFIVTNYFFTAVESLRALFLVHAILLVVLHLFYAIALWVKPQD